MPDLYPLILEPLFKERVWGGRRLERFFGAALPPGPIGEAWVLGEHGQDTNVVMNGPLAGQTLTQLRRDYGPAMLGTGGTTGPGGRLPILIKLLDARADLSVQVHPGDFYEGLSPGETGKTEMWYVLEADPGAEIVYGLQEGVTQPVLAGALGTGQVRECLRRVRVSAGDALYVPAGTVHALGSGVVVAEVQQSSDTTYRLYDYDRLGLDGKPRALHLEHALRVTSYEAPGKVIRPRRVPPNHWKSLVHCPFFHVDRARCEGPLLQRTNNVSFDALLVCSGQGAIAWNGGLAAMSGGQAVLVPANLGVYEVEGNTELLRVRVPDRSEGSGS